MKGIPVAAAGALLLVVAMGAVALFLNSMPTGAIACTMIYGTYELSINVGTDFRAGVTYTARVNDKATTFVGR